jgi:hypothetical protein
LCAKPEIRTFYQQKDSFSAERTDLDAQTLREVAQKMHASVFEGKRAANRNADGILLFAKRARKTDRSWTAARQRRF